jgi:hypothetical protein
MEQHRCLSPPAVQSYVISQKTYGRCHVRYILRQNVVPAACPGGIATAPAAAFILILSSHLEHISRFVTFSDDTLHLRRINRLTHSTELNPSSEATTCSDTEHFPNMLWNRNVHYRVHKSLPLAPSLSEITQFVTPHISLSYQPRSDRLRGLSGQSSWLQIRRPGFDSLHYEKKK